MQVNLLGHSFSTHYLWATLSYTIHKNEDCFQEMLLQFGSDLRECFDKGIDFHGRTLRLVCIGLKADMKLQARAGQMTRWYATARKAPYDPNSRTQSSGRCCWLCLGGDVAYPYEEIHSENPAWLGSMQLDTEPPWDDECGLVSFSLRYEKPATFFLPDLFHIYLAGFGQDYAASALVYLLPIAFQSPYAASVEAHFEVLNTCWKAWKKMFKVTTHTRTFNRYNMTYLDNTKTYPSGTWSKASDTAKIIAFIEYISGFWLDDHPNDKMLHYIHVTSKAIGVSMRCLYDSDLWIATYLKMVFYVQNNGFKNVSSFLFHLFWFILWFRPV